MSHTVPIDDPRPGLCKRRRKDGGQCGARAIAGTDSCRKHGGVPARQLHAKGAVVVELRQWGLTSQRDLADPGETLLRLVTQSAARCELYADLLRQAFEAADRLRAAEGMPEPDEDLTVTARMDLERVLNHGAVASLIGHTYAGTQTSGVIATGERIRGLVDLEAQERDRCANFASKAVAAGLAERQVRLHERMGGQMAIALATVVRALGHDPESPEVRQLVAAQIGALVGGTKVIEGEPA